MNTFCDSSLYIFGLSHIFRYMPGFSRVKTSTITFKGVEFLLRLWSPKFEIVQSYYDKLMKKKNASIFNDTIWNNKTDKKRKRYKINSISLLSSQTAWKIHLKKLNSIHLHDVKLFIFLLGVKCSTSIWLAIRLIKCTYQKRLSQSVRKKLI